MNDIHSTYYMSNTTVPSRAAPPDFADYPPRSVLVVTSLVDSFCNLAVPCSSWRNFVGVSKGSWLSAQVPWMSTYLKPLPTYSQYAAGAGTVESSSESFLQSWWTYAFKTPSTALSDLSTPSALVVVVALVMLLRPLKAMLLSQFRSVGLQAALHEHGRDWVLNNQYRIVKFSENLYRWCFHSLISLYGVWYLHDKIWWRPGSTSQMWQGYSHQPIDPGMNWFYLLQAAYNVDTLLTLVDANLTFQIQPIQSRKGLWQAPVAIRWRPNALHDFFEYFIHDVAATLLIFWSSIMRFHRVGSVVFVLHDVSDVAFYMSLMINFLKWKVTTVVGLFTMNIVWFYFRIYMFAFTVFRSSIFESYHLLEAIPVLVYLIYQPFFLVLMGALLALHTKHFVEFWMLWLNMVEKLDIHIYFKSWTKHLVTEY